MRLDELRARIESLPRNAWTLQRFGLTPSKLPHRVANGDMPRMFCVSLPKAGTHLLERAICLHPRLYRKLTPTIAPGMARWDGLDRVVRHLRPGQMVVAHLPFDPRYPDVLEKGMTRPIIVVRDPRDVILSQVLFVEKRRHHPFQEAFRARPTLTEKLELAINGDPHSRIPSIRERLERYAGWLSSGYLVVRFEELIGESGGGDAATQESTVRSIYRYLEVRVNDAFIRDICDRLFSSESPTFRRGAIGQWRERFDEDLTALFDQVAGDLIEGYGYPR